MCATCSTGTVPNVCMSIHLLFVGIIPRREGKKKSPGGAGVKGGEGVKFTLEVEPKEIAELLRAAEVRQEAIEANKMQGAIVQAVKTLMRNERLSREERSRQSRLQREESEADDKLLRDGVALPHR